MQSSQVTIQDFNFFQSGYLEPLLLSYLESFAIHLILQEQISPPRPIMIQDLLELLIVGGKQSNAQVSWQSTEELQ